MAADTGQSSRKELSRIIFTYEERIQRYFARQLADEEDIQDLTQDVICALMDAYPRFRGESSLATWVFSICRNHLYLHYRTKRRRRELISRLAHHNASTYEDSQAIFDLACERLSAEKRQLFTEYYRNRMSVKELAAVLERPEGTIKYLLYELRRDLKHILG